VAGVLGVLTVLSLLETIPSFEDEAQALASFRPVGYAARARIPPHWRDNRFAFENQFDSKQQA